MSKRGFTLAEGQPVPDPSVSTTLPIVGGGGITTLGDTLLLETLAHFNRERIPERVVHANGFGAWGEFEVTNDISHLTCANFLNGVGKKTAVLCRFSTTGGEKGTANTVRDVRGFSVKFFTEEGNHDLVAVHIPVFFVRDPVRFPSVNRSHKRHPATNRPDWTMFWDFHVNQPEGVHALMHLFGSRGLPSSIRRMPAFGIHTFKLVGHYGRFHYCKFHLRPEEGVSNLSSSVGARLAGANPDFHSQDLWEAIERRRYPVWKLYIQVMEPSRAEDYGRALFDVTKVWPHSEFPLIEVGKMTLNKNPENSFAEIEQAAFSPANMVPGIAMTPDPMLQARMFAYPDALRYRLGVNYAQLPPNRPRCPVFAPYERDGQATITENYKDEPSYWRSSRSSGESSPSVHAIRHKERLQSSAALGLNEIPVDEEDFVQPRALWLNVFDETERQAWGANVADTLVDVPPELRRAVVDMFGRVHKSAASILENRLHVVSRL